MQFKISVFNLDEKMGHKKHNTHKTDDRFPFYSVFAVGVIMAQRHNYRSIVRLTLFVALEWNKTRQQWMEEKL